LLSLCLPLFLAPLSRGQADIKFFPLSEVRPGLKGVGRTIFQGDKIEEFQVEILGVIKGAVVPKQDLILARLSGGPLAETGVIAGMSGSPVYIDGKLVGAVAVAFPFSKEPITGITPIEQMVDVVPQARVAANGHSEATRAASGDLGFRIVADPSGARLISDPADGAGGLPAWMKRFTTENSPNSMANVSLPLHFGGFSSSLVSSYAPIFRQMGFEPMAGGILAAAPESQAQDPGEVAKSLAPGSMVSLFLVSGDLNLNADCTVTYRKGDDLYACGHRLLQVGPIQIPFAPAHVLATVPSLSSSFKLDVPGEPVGTVQQDRFAAIYGVIGNKPSLIPVHIRLDSTLNRQTDYNFRIVQEPFLSPTLLNLAVVSALTATERAMGPSTLEIKGKILLSGGESVNLEDVASSEMSAAGAAGLAIATPLNYILNSNFPDMRVEGIDLSVVSQDERRIANVEQVWATQSEVHPGDHIEVTALLRTPSGESLIQKIPVTIPESVNDNTLSLIVGSGSSLDAMQFHMTPLAGVPRNLEQLVRALNRMRRNNRLYALLLAPQRSFTLQGDEYPSPPPSLLQTLMAEPSAPSSATFSWTSVIGDFETQPTIYTIRGDKMLLLKVASESN
jgi:hypothetical protein